MEACGYPDKRVKYLNEKGDFTYIRDGELLKIELKHVLKALGVWNKTFETKHKRAYRGHIRDHVGLEYDSMMGWEPFSLHDLTRIWRCVADD